MNGISSQSFSVDPPPLSASRLEAGEETASTVGRHDRDLWQALKHWTRKNTLFPRRLPGPLRHPLSAYVIAALTELAAVVVTLILSSLAPAFGFHGILVLVVLVLVAMGWGAGPGVFASLTGVLLLWLVVLPPHFHWKVPDPANGLALLLSLVICMPISLLVGGSARARQQAEETARHLAQVEAQSRSDAERLRTILEVLPSGVLITNREGQLLAMNQAARRFWDGDIPIGTDIRQFPQDKLWWAQSGNLVAPEEMPLVRVLRSGQPVLKEELEMEVQDGKRKVMLYSVAPLRDETGALTGAIISAQDISELRRLEREAVERAAQTKAQMDTFLGIASHELKTPLTSLKLSLQLSQRRLNRLTRDQPATSPLGEDLGLQAAIEQMSRTAHQMERLEALVNDLVDVSRIQAGQLELHLAPTNLVALVTEAVEVQQQAAPDRRLLLHLPSPAARPLEVEGDGGRLEQVLTNFLTNALKYSPATAPVEVGLELQTDLAATEPPQVRVWVHDQGPGLPHSEQAQIWERFHRVPGVEVQSGTGVGLGLGLYICRMIIQRHHGQVGVHSTPGQGSTFWFSLPLQYTTRHDQ
jgi:signal transduction histidine kinase